MNALNYAHPGDIFETTPENKPESKIHPSTGHESPEVEQKYSSTISLTSALHEGVWSMECPGRFTRYPVNRRLGGLQDRSRQVQNILPPPGFDPPLVQALASR